jgi:branched-chain amino acid transport system permease protein
MYAVLAQSWDLLFGYTGITSFCHAAFLGIGAYTSALLAINFGLSPWAGLIAGGLAAAATSLLIGATTLRIKIAAFLATTTIAFNEIARITINDQEWLTRGPLGLWGIPSFPSLNIGAFEINFGGAGRSSACWLIAILFALTSFFLYKLVNSRIGLRLRALREDPDAAESVGIDTTKYKLMSLFIGAFLAGAMGSFYAHYIGTIDPSLLSLEQQVLLMVMVISGGRGTLYGGVFSSIIIISSLEFLRPLGPGRLIVYGIVLILTLRFAENGVFKMLVDKLTVTMKRR